VEIIMECVAKEVAVASVGPPCGVFAGVTLGLTGVGVGIASAIINGMGGRRTPSRRLV
jgi:hypothetical protein